MVEGDHGRCGEEVDGLNCNSPKLQIFIVVLIRVNITAKTYWFRFMENSLMFTTYMPA